MPIVLLLLHLAKKFQNFIIPLTTPILKKVLLFQSCGMYSQICPPKNESMKTQARTRFGTAHSNYMKNAFSNVLSVIVLAVILYYALK
jgi:hypothetical protein